MRDTEKLTLVGVIGNPISHSKSPVIHNYWLSRHNVNSYYVPLEVSDQNFLDVLRVLPKMGFRGVNITIPHKEIVLQHSDSVSDQAALIGAANTISFRPDGKIYALNTDGYGFLQNMKQNLPSWDAKQGPALVIGAGGAARAVIHSLISNHTPVIYVLNRTLDRAEILRSELGNRVKVVDRIYAFKVLGEISTLVNTSALGMIGKPELIFPVKSLRKETVVCDLVYTPLKTRFLRDAEAHGCRTVDGLGMLLHQAAASFDFWYGVRPEVDEKVRNLVLDQ